jgi:hypothetical protein
MDESYLKKQRLNPGLPSENFNDNLNNFSMNKSNINNYLYYLNKWTNDIKENPKNVEILNKYVGTAFAFTRDLQKYPTLRQINYDYDNYIITPSDIVNKIKYTNKFIIDNLLTGDITNQAKFVELNRNLNSGNFKGGKKRKTLRRKTNKKMKKTYKKRRVSRRRK